MGWQPLLRTLVRLSRGYVAVTGPEAADFLERMVSNEVASLEPGDDRRALLLTPKGRIVAPLRAVREGPEAFLLITEAELAETLASTLLRARFAAKCEIEVKPYRGYLRLGDGEGIRNDDYGVEAYESWDEEEREAARRRRARAAAHRGGHAGLGQRARRDASFPPRPGSTRRTSRSRRAATRARSRSRGCTTAATRTGGCACSRSRRRARATRFTLARKSVGRVTSAVPGRALGYVRREVPDDAALSIERPRGAATLAPPAPVAQGIERCPAEAEVASSNLAGRIPHSLQRPLFFCGQRGHSRAGVVRNLRTRSGGA